MPWKDLVLRLRALLFRHRMDEDLQEELNFHLEMQARKYREKDLAPAEARRIARLHFGNLEFVKEECRDQRGITKIDVLMQDLCFGARMLRKSPAFTITSLVTLALVIGANVVVFAILNTLILRPLNVPRAESLYSIQRVSDHSSNQSYPDYLDLRARNRSFEDLAAFSILQAGLDTGENPSRVWLLAVSGNYFDVLGIRPYLGRFFHDSDEHGTNSAPYIVLSHAYWHSRFHDDRSVVGRVVRLNQQPFTIIGVAPPGFRGTLLFFSPDFFVPMINQEQIEGTNVLDARGTRWIFMTMGHLKTEVTPTQAAADISSIRADLEKIYPELRADVTFALARPGLLGDFLGRPVRAFLTALMFLAGLILLAACANLGSLFGARAADRSREIAMRMALGASRRRILRQLFTEAILISGIGGVIGLFGSLMLLRWLSVWQPFAQFPIHLPVTPDTTVFAVTLLFVLASGLLIGAVPVKQVFATEPHEIIKSGSTGGVGSRITMREALLVVQVAICAVLITASVVAVRGLVRSLRGNFGFEARNAILLSTVLDMAGYRGNAVAAMQKRMIQALETIPGVTSVGLVDWAPLTIGDGKGDLVFADETADLRPANAAATSLIFKISPDYFRAAGTRLLSGRGLSWSDEKDAPRVAVINHEFARKVFGSANNAMGRFYRMWDGTRIQVVGITEDGKYETLTENPKPAMFLPFLQSQSTETSLVIRSQDDPKLLAEAIRIRLQNLDSGLPCFIQTWDSAMNMVLFPSRAAAISLGILGVMGALLSVTGIFGSAAYSVSRRMRELGIRRALGAQHKHVLQVALGRPLKLLALGSAAGLVLGFLAGRVLTFVVYQATPRDPVVLACVVLALSLLGLLATWIPAQRALSSEPLILLRHE